MKTETEIADEQAGFRQGRGTRDQITNLRILMHEAREHQQAKCPVFKHSVYVLCELQTGIRLYCTSRDKLWVTMMEWDILCTYSIDLLAKLYTGNRSLRLKQREHYQNGFALIKESDKVASFLRTC